MRLTYPTFLSGRGDGTTPIAPRLPKIADIYTQLPTSHLDSGKKKSPFDPGYVHDPYNYNSYNPSDPYSPYDLPPPLSSIGHDSRDVLPWSNDPPEYGPPLDPMLKEERMRMLEREFGSKGKDKGKGNGKALVDEDGRPLVGTVDEKGKLVTTGPKRRITLRLLQIVFAAGACIPAIYAAIAIKAKDPADLPPPANKPPVFVLYVLSSITLLLLLYMFCIRPCCCVRSKKRSKHPLGAAANMGMMVLPVGNAAGGKKNKKPKGKKHKKYGPGAGSGDVQVNLIVDPNAFHPPEASESEEEEEDGYDSMDGSMPGGYDSRRKDKARRARRRRRGVFEGLAMEEEWRAARAWAKKVAMVDVAGIVLWGAAFVFIMTGKRCPSGGYEGWCTAYNVSTACACLLAVAFCVTTFFDVQDLSASKQSPRTRT
ncbi:unnamed protein product [Cyclocybe aegerita]|uniref:Uncharacterized protein n=1 Tax=Cyclocybe aegerita TaxID=1973307 RepID=A0A8S0W1I7_CYCAE|nr:unnamed protein product [Cyclocybe aegerita]